MRFLMREGGNMEKKPVYEALVLETIEFTVEDILMESKEAPQTTEWETPIAQAGG